MISHCKITRTVTEILSLIDKNERAHVTWTRPLWRYYITSARTYDD